MKNREEATICVIKDLVPAFNIISNEEKWTSNPKHLLRLFSVIDKLYITTLKALKDNFCL